METLNILTGEKRLAVSVDGVNGREIVFNPNDVLFVERLHRFYRVVTEKAQEWQARQAELEKKAADTPTDKNGVPESLEAVTEPLEEMNRFMREQIDTIFGAGTSKVIFGEVVYRNPAVYVQLIEGIKPYIEPVRAQKVKQYIAPKPKKARKRAK